MSIVQTHRLDHFAVAVIMNWFTKFFQPQAQIRQMWSSNTASHPRRETEFPGGKVLTYDARFNPECNAEC